MTTHDEKRLQEIREWVAQIGEDSPFNKPAPTIGLVKDGIPSLLNLVERQEKENARLRETLKFYADNDIHTVNFDFHDNGKRARAALEGK